MDAFLSWLSGISFSGGGFSEAAISEGLAEALMILQGSPGNSQNHQNHEVQKHCILIAASNPYPLPTPVYRLPVQSSDHKENNEATKESCLADAEIVAKSFAQCSVSLSVVSPKQLPTLKAIYNAGKRNPRAADPSVDHAKHSHFLVLLSENFMEARTALSCPGNLVPNQTITKMDAPAVTVSGPTSNINPTVNGPMMVRGVGIPTTNIKVEPTTIPPMVSAPAFSHISALQSSSPSIISQETDVANDSVQEHKPLVNPIQQPIRPGGPANVSILNNLSQHRQMNSTSLAGTTSMGLSNMGATSIQVHMSNMISSGMTSAPSVISSMSGTGQPIGTQQMVQSTALGSFGSNTSAVSGKSNIAVSSSLANIQSNMGMGQSVPPVAQGGLMAGSQLGQGGIGTNQNMISGLGATAISSAPAMMPTPGMAQQAGVNSLGVANNSAMNMPMGQHPNAQQQQQSKYVKIWEGSLSGQRQGQPVFICKLEGYRNGTASDTLAADWPETMQIVRLIAQEHMNNKQYVGKADFLVFRTLNQHGFLGQLQEKKLCAVIQLPSQTLLLSVSDKAGRLIGMLFPGLKQVFPPPGYGGIQTTSLNSAATDAAAAATTAAAVTTTAAPATAATNTTAATTTAAHADAAAGPPASAAATARPPTSATAADAANATAADAANATAAAAATDAANAAAIPTASATAADGGCGDGAAIHAGAWSDGADDARKDCAAGVRQHAWGRLPILKCRVQTDHHVNNQTLTPQVHVSLVPPARR